MRKKLQGMHYLGACPAASQDAPPSVLAAQAAVPACRPQASSAKRAALVIGLVKQLHGRNTS